MTSPETPRELVANAAQILSGASTTSLGAKYIDATSADRMMKLLLRAMDQLGAAFVGSRS